MEWSKLFHGVGSNLMPSYSARTSGATSGASAGAGIGTMILPGVGTAVGAALGGIGGWLMGGSTDSAFDKRQKRIQGELGQMQTTLKGRIPEILEYYTKLEVQSDEEDRIQTESGINQFLTASNQLFSQGQQVTSQANLAYGGPMSEDIQRQFDEQFSNYETQRDTQDLSADRDMSSIGLARTEAVEKVDDLVSSLEIDKLKYS